MINRIPALLAAVVLVSILAAPAIQMATRLLPEVELRGWEPPPDPCPQDLATGWLDGSLQRCIDSLVRTRLGFRGAITRTFNEIEFRLFGQRNDLFYNSRAGLYGSLQVDYLNATIRNADTLREQYRRIALKTRIVEQLLEERGVYFITVIAASKVFVNPFPLSRRYLSTDPERAFAVAARFGAALDAAGARNLDFTRILRMKQLESPLPFHGKVGLHWNFYAGCLAAGMLADRIRDDTGLALRHFTCSPPTMEPAHSVDIDGLYNMNLWSDQSLRDLQPYPVLRVTEDEEAERPRVLMIGDSFSDQLRKPLVDAKLFSYLDFSSYLATHQVIPGDPDQAPEPQRSIDKATLTFAKDIQPYRVVILQAVDYNIQRNGYGFLERMLDDLLPSYAWGLPLVTDGAPVEGLAFASGLEQNGKALLTQGQRAILAVKGPATATGIRLQGRVHWASGDRPPMVELAVNGVEVGAFTPETGKDTRFDLDIPDEVLAIDRVAVIEISVKDDGADHGLLIHDLALGAAGPYADDTAPAVPAGDRYAWGEVISLDAKHPDHRRYLGQGWSNAEDALTWTDGKRADIVLPVYPPNSDLMLVLKPVAVNGNQTLQVSLGDRQLDSFTVDTALPSEYVVRLPRALVTGRSKLAFSLSIPGAFSPASRGYSADPRTLGFGFSELRVLRIRN